MSRQNGKHRQKESCRLRRLPFTLLLLLCLMLATVPCVQCAAVQGDAPEVLISASPKAVSIPAVTPQPSAPPDMPSPSPVPSPDLSPSPPPPPPILPELAQKYEKNPDLIGWLFIKGTVINYPVMYTPDAHDYYLTHNFEKKKDKKGLLVLQADCDPYTPGTNLIIHGHKMKNGKMFGTLAKYKSKSYWKKHRTIRFDTLYVPGEYEIIAVFLSKVYKDDEDGFRYYRFTDVDTQETFDKFYGNIKKISLYDTGVTAQPGDHFITLSTCSYHTKDGRFVVVAKKAA